MAKRQKRTLADYVEASERRDGPRAQARDSRGGGGLNIWFGLVAVVVVLLASAIAFLRFRGVI
jgi:hypothetical protein